MNLSRSTRNYVPHALAFLATIGAAPAVKAWDGAVTATVSAYEVVALEGGGHNYDFRVHLSGVSAMCTGGASWGYINTDAGNYKATVAALILAHQTGKPVTIYSNKDALGYCQIGHLMVR